jgi:hypothetical protein
LPFGILPRQSKINNLDIAIFEHNVGRLKIPMNDINLAHGIHGLDNLREYPNGFVLIKFRVGLDIFRQIATLTILQKNIEIRFCLFHINATDNVLVLASV